MTLSVLLVFFSAAGQGVPEEEEVVEERRINNNKQQTNNKINYIINYRINLFIYCSINAINVRACVYCQ